MGENLSRVKCKFLQKSVFRWCQFNFFASNSYPSLSKVNLEVTAGKGGLSGYSGSCFSAAKHCPDPSYQFTRTKRLGDIVVSSKVKALHLVTFIASGTEHDNRDLRPLTKPAAEPVPAPTTTYE